MMRAALCLAAASASLLALGCATQAQSGSKIAQWLQEGYEIKAAFYDNAGGAYILLQKGTSAYLCHSSPNQTCEKLN